MLCKCLHCHRYKVTEGDSANRWDRRAALPVSVAFVSISCTDLCRGKPEQANPIPAPAKHPHAAYAVEGGVSGGLTETGKSEGRLFGWRARSVEGNVTKTSSNRRAPQAPAVSRLDLGRTASVFVTFFGFSNAIASLGSLFAKPTEMSFLGSCGDA